MIRDTLSRLAQVEALLEDATVQSPSPLAKERDALLASLAELSPGDKVYLARHVRRPRIDETVQALFEDFFELRGDRLGGEDRSILGGIARFHGQPVTVIGNRKGRCIQENMALHFGMTSPQGYRKAQRLMRQAEKFGRPVITFIDTPGAYPGMEAEAGGQSEAIAACLAQMSRLHVPVVCVITGEGSSGGALALAVANRVLMLENAYYSVVSPEGCASILWKDAARRGEACDMLHLTAQDMLAFGVIDEIIPEVTGGAQRDHKALFSAMDAALKAQLGALSALDGEALYRQRMERFRRF